jgi:hypothetical protein
MKNSNFADFLKKKFREKSRRQLDEEKTLSQNLKLGYFNLKPRVEVSNIGMTPIGMTPISKKITLLLDLL